MRISSRGGGSFRLWRISRVDYPWLRALNRADSNPGMLLVPVIFYCLAVGGNVLLSVVGDQDGSTGCYRLKEAVQGGRGHVGARYLHVSSRNADVLHEACWYGQSLFALGPRANCIITTPIPVGAAARVLLATVSAATSRASSTQTSRYRRSRRATRPRLSRNEACARVGLAAAVLAHLRVRRGALRHLSRCPRQELSTGGEARASVSVPRRAKLVSALQRSGDSVPGAEARGELGGVSL